MEWPFSCGTLVEGIEGDEDMMLDNGVDRNRLLDGWDVAMLLLLSDADAPTYGFSLSMSCNPLLLLLSLLLLLLV